MCENQIRNFLQMIVFNEWTNECVKRRKRKSEEVMKQVPTYNRQLARPSGCSCRDSSWTTWWTLCRSHRNEGLPRPRHAPVWRKKIMTWRKKYQMPRHFLSRTLCAANFSKLDFNIAIGCTILFKWGLLLLPCKIQFLNRIYDSKLCFQTARHRQREDTRARYTF